jgi:hypothetical protein
VLLKRSDHYFSSDGDHGYSLMKLLPLGDREEGLARGVKPLFAPGRALVFTLLLFAEVVWMESLRRIQDEEGVDVRDAKTNKQAHTGVLKEE